jgi:CRP-like cAMP-binding protein
MQSIPLFNQLSPDVLELVEPLFEACTCHAGTIFEQGDPAVYLYLVLSGSVDILYKPYDGPIITITNIKPGGIFGWSAIAGNSTYTSGAACHEKCSALRIQGSTLRTLCLDHPVAGEELLDRLADSVSTRWHDARQQVRDILDQGLSQ